MPAYVGVVWAAVGRRIKERKEIFQIEDTTCARPCTWRNLSMCYVQEKKRRAGAYREHRNDSMKQGCLEK